jgi:hypothetical protein
MAPNLQFHIFEFLDQVHGPIFSRRSGTSWSLKVICILVGYSEISKAYCLYDPSTHKVIECRDVVFDEILTHDPLGYFHYFPPMICRWFQWTFLLHTPMMILPFYECFLKHSFYNDKDIWILMVRILLILLKSLLL